MFFGADSFFWIVIPLHLPELPGLLGHRLYARAFGEFLANQAGLALERSNIVGISGAGKLSVLYRDLGLYPYRTGVFRLWCSLAG